MDLEQDVGQTAVLSSRRRFCGYQTDSVFPLSEVRIGYARKSCRMVRLRTKIPYGNFDVCTKRIGPVFGYI
jgi:hypothetical protein